ncbi:related to CTI6 Cyc8-Tup1 Interacting protein [Rhynchosporium graminicola]|uniref:Transcription factor BYE1 n=1 Tax=Rhynchosporium graminicola TaxID=2792576 RepID=A0A1E1KG58_9HELO|nr:related to CTI6 Cyc8-Tup1 Interacting protein [Rhynchosporium commune]
MSHDLPPITTTARPTPDLPMFGSGSILAHVYAAYPNRLNILPIATSALKIAYKLNMADEPRRSVRATKGVHTGKMDLDSTPEPKKKGGKKKKVEKEEDPEVIRCVCGAIDSPEGDEEPWIACDQCTVWQHNVCVGITTFEDEIPEHYLCELCDPGAHKELLDGMKKGIRVWEIRQKKYNAELAKAEKAEKAEKEAQSAKGKKKGKRVSDSVTNGKGSTPSTPLKKETPRAGSAKRKIRDESQDEPKPKVRKVSAAPAPAPAQTPRQESPPSDLAVRLSEIHDILQEAGAKLIMKNLKPAISHAINHRVYTLAPNDTLDAKTERLAIQIQAAVKVQHDEKQTYLAQCRTITANLKLNQELTDRLLKHTLQPLTLASMSSDDMASKELKKEVAGLKARAEKQSIMITDDGPRMRRTHKGEEVVEDDNFAMPVDSMPTSRRRSMLDPNGQMATRSRENSPGTLEGEDINSYRGTDDIRGNAAPKLAVQTRKPSQPDFDYNKVVSQVAASPITSQHVRRESSNNAPPVSGPGVDPEIDKMLQDDEGDSDAYSPAEYPTDPDIVWQGTLTMESVARFPATAKHVAGFGDKAHSASWKDNLQSDLRIAGRIDQDKANEYLCSLRYSPPTDVAVVSITPSGEASDADFYALYHYFDSKKRYGVLTNKGLGNIRDTYLVPVPPSPGSIPDFVTNLEGHKVPEIRSDPMILVTLVIRNNIPVDTLRFGGDSPTVVNHAQRQMSISGIGPAMSPVQPQGAYSAPPLPHQGFPQDEPQPQPHHQQVQGDDQRTADQRAGETTAAEILGPYRDAPTVAFLMPQAYQMRPVEWQIIRGILEEDEKARNDLQHMSQVLEVRMQTHEMEARR